MGYLYRRLDNLRKKILKNKIPQGVFLFKATHQDPADCKYISKIMKKYGGNRIFIIHGSAFRDRNKITMICDPPGMGKSTYLRKINRENSEEISPIEDGFVLVIGKKGKFFIIDRGIYYYNELWSRYIKKVRKFLHIKQVYRTKKISDFEFKLFEFVHRWVHLLVSFVVTMLMKDRSHERFRPRLHKLEKFVYIVHSRDALVPKQVFENHIRGMPYTSFDKIICRSVDTSRMTLDDFHKMAKK